MTLLLWTLAAIGLSGFLTLPFGRRSSGGQWLAALVAASASVVAFWVTLQWLLSGAEPESIKLPWNVIGRDAATFHLALDTISAVFLLPILVVSFCGSIYGLGYWKQSEHPENGRKLRLFYGLLIAGMGVVVLARNGILFLFGWETMALSAFFLVTTEDHDPEVREVGWIYLVATHVATLVLFALFGVLYHVTGSFEFTALGIEGRPPVVSESAFTLVPEATATAIFFLALIGFGLKAGVMPLHVWLPGAHAMAPSHVSAVMSGVILKMGIYGIVRINSLIHHPPAWWGLVVLIVGVISALLGIAFAVGQRDFKRMLAYSSIENIGIIFIGLGLSLVGRSMSRLDWIILGISGALLHVWNHAAFKSLLFYSAGSLLHAVNTRQMDQLGGLIKSMPKTAICFLVGAVATCALPPLNGFISELYIYVGLFHTLDTANRTLMDGISIAAPLLAMVGALAVACFVGAYGCMFLGVGRSEATDHAHESSPLILAPMFLLVGICFFLGLMPSAAESILNRAAMAWAPDRPEPNRPVEHWLGELVPLETIGWMQVLLLALIVVGVILLRIRIARSVVERTGTWGCGYMAPKPRMQYTPSSFAAILVNLFGWALQPRKKTPHIKELFPAEPQFKIDVRDTVLDNAILPASDRFARSLSWFRWMQQGSVQAYLMYILVTLLILLFWR